MQNQTILEHLRDYLDYLNCKWLERGKKTCSCPICKENSGSIIKDTWQFSCVACKFIGNIYDLVKKLEVDMKDLSDEEIEDYLNYILQIQSDVNTEKALEMYQQLGFCLVPVVPNGKKPTEMEWTKKEHKDIREWKDWLKSGSNVGIRTGKCSGITVLDLDFYTQSEKDELDKITITSERKQELITKKTIPAELKELLGETLVQNTRGGWHILYKYCEDLPKSKGKLFGVNVDLENDGGQIVSYPSIVNGHKRKWYVSPIIEMPSKLKELLKKNLKSTDVKDVSTPDFELDSQQVGMIEEGSRDDSMTRIGGVLRKKLNKEQVSYVLNTVINPKFCNPPLKGFEIKRIVDSLDRYSLDDQDELTKNVLNHLRLVKEATARDLVDSIRYDRKAIETVLAKLVQDKIVYKTRSVYRLAQKVQWKETFVDECKLLPYKMPYFDEYCTLRDGDLILIGAGTGSGKGHIALNMIKQFVDQEQSVNYLSLESGNRFSQIAMALGLKEGSFKWANVYNPEDVELEDNSITILDWLLPKSYESTDQLYKGFAEQLDIHRGILIVFCQLKKLQNGDLSFFAPNMIEMFPSLTAMYLYEKEGNGYSNEKTYFLTQKIRESKVGRQKIIIPTQYDHKTKLITLRKT